MSDVIVRLAHVRAAYPGQCTRGLRNWCAHHDIAWSDFVREGVPASVLRATGDALVEPIIAVAGGVHG